MGECGGSREGGSAVKVTIVCTKSSVTVHDMAADDVAELLEAWEYGESTITIALDQDSDDDRAVTHIASRHIVRIDVEE